MISYILDSLNFYIIEVCYHENCFLFWIDYLSERINGKNLFFFKAGKNWRLQRVVNQNILMSTAMKHIPVKYEYLLHILLKFVKKYSLQMMLVILTSNVRQAFVAIVSWFTLSCIHVCDNKLIIEYTILGIKLASYILSVLWIFVLIELPCNRSVQWPWWKALVLYVHIPSMPVWLFASCLIGFLFNVSWPAIIYSFRSIDLMHKLFIFI